MNTNQSDKDLPDILDKHLDKHCQIDEDLPDILNKHLFERCPDILNKLFVFLKERDSRHGFEKLRTDNRATRILFLAKKALQPEKKLKRGYSLDSKRACALNDLEDMLEFGDEYHVERYLLRLLYEEGDSDERITYHYISSELWFFQRRQNLAGLEILRYYLKNLIRIAEENFVAKEFIRKAREKGDLPSYLGNPEMRKEEYTEKNELKDKMKELEKDIEHSIYYLKRIKRIQQKVKDFVKEMESALQLVVHACQDNTTMLENFKELLSHNAEAMKFIISAMEEQYKEDPEIGEIINDIKEGMKVIKIAKAAKEEKDLKKKEAEKEAKLKKPDDMRW